MEHALDSVNSNLQLTSNGAQFGGPVWVFCVHLLSTTDNPMGLPFGRMGCRTMSSMDCYLEKGWQAKSRTAVWRTHLGWTTIWRHIMNTGADVICLPLDASMHGQPIEVANLSRCMSERKTCESFFCQLVCLSNFAREGDIIHADHCDTDLGADANLEVIKPLVKITNFSGPSAACRRSRNIYKYLGFVSEMLQTRQDILLNVDGGRVGTTTYLFGMMCTGENTAVLTPHLAPLKLSTFDPRLEIPESISNTTFNSNTIIKILQFMMFRSGV